MVIETPETWAEYKVRVARFWAAALMFWRGRRAWVAWSLCAVLLVLVLAQLGVQFLLNYWNGRFFDALEKRDGVALAFEAKLFVPLVVMSVGLSAAAVVVRMTTQRKWREAMTRNVVDRWLSDNRFQRIGHVNSGSENPEYRIAEDIRLATDAPVDLATALVSSVSDRAHLLRRAVERRRLAHRQAVRHRRDHSRLSGVRGDGVFDRLHLDDVPDRAPAAQGDRAEEPGRGPLPRRRRPAARPDARRSWTPPIRSGAPSGSG